jgi:hypothetical protein
VNKVTPVTSPDEVMSQHTDSSLVIWDSDYGLDAERRTVVA